MVLWGICRIYSAFRGGVFVQNSSSNSPLYIAGCLHPDRAKLCRKISQKRARIYVESFVNLCHLAVKVNGNILTTCILLSKKNIYDLSQETWHRNSFIVSHSPLCWEQPGHPSPIKNLDASQGTLHWRS